MRILSGGIVRASDDSCNNAIDQRFVDRSRQCLTATYLPKIEVAVAQLSDDEIWWRPNPASNAIGHLLLSGL